MTDKEEHDFRRANAAIIGGRSRSAIAPPGRLVPHQGGLWGKRQLTRCVGKVEGRGGRKGLERRHITVVNRGTSGAKGGDGLPPPTKSQRSKKKLASTGLQFVSA